MNSSIWWIQILTPLISMFSDLSVPSASLKCARFVNRKSFQIYQRILIRKHLWESRDWFRRLKFTFELSMHRSSGTKFAKERRVICTPYTQWSLHQQFAHGIFSKSKARRQQLTFWSRASASPLTGSCVGISCSMVAKWKQVIDKDGTPTDINLNWNWIQ